MQNLHDLQDLEGEIWKEVIDYEGYYQVSNMGRVKSLERTAINGNNNSIMPIKKRILIGGYTSDGYRRVTLSINKIKTTFRISRLVGVHFIPNPENKPQINHKNGIRDDNRSVNLEWNTNKENIRHSIDILGRVIKTENLKNEFGIEHCRNKKVYQFDLKGNLVGDFFSCAEASRILGFSRSNISNCARESHKEYKGFRWSYDKNQIFTMNKFQANKIADKITHSELKEMFENAKTQIKDWTKPSRINKSISIGTAFNILYESFNSEEQIKYRSKLAKRNMIFEFKDFLPKHLIPEKKLKNKSDMKVAHQEPKF